MKENHHNLVPDQMWSERGGEDGSDVKSLEIEIIFTEVNQRKKWLRDKISFQIC